MLPVYRRLGLGRLYDALPGAVGPVYASNNWVVDGRHSASGKPLLANDPHLLFGAPGPWYLAVLKTPGHEIAGATAPGIPLVVIGHNDHIAWGFTTTTADVEDLFRRKGRSLRPRPISDPGGQRPVCHPRRDNPGARCRTGRFHRTRDPARPGPFGCAAGGHGRPRLRAGVVGDLSRRPTTAAPRRCGTRAMPPTGRAFARLAQFCRTDAKHRLRRRQRHDRVYRAGPGADPQKGRRLDAGAGLDRRL